MTYPRAALVWLVLFAAAVANGALRDLAYSRYLGERAAHQLSTLALIAIFWLLIRAATKVWRLRSRAQAWRIGLLWTAMTIALETGMGRFLGGHSWREVFADYAVWNGRLWPLVLAWLLVAPALCFRLDRRRAVS